MVHLGRQYVCMNQQRHEGCARMHVRVHFQVCTLHFDQGKSAHKFPVVRRVLQPRHERRQLKPAHDVSADKILRQNGTKRIGFGVVELPLGQQRHQHVTHCIGCPRYARRNAFMRVGCARVQASTTRSTRTFSEACGCGKRISPTLTVHPPYTACHAATDWHCIVPCAWTVHRQHTCAYRGTRGRNGCEHPEREVTAGNIHVRRSGA